MSAFVRLPAQGKLTGVAAGISDLMRIDPLAVRLALVLAVLLTGPVVAILYLAAALLADAR